MPALLNRTGMRTAAALVLAAVIGAAPERALAQDVERRPWSEIVVIVGHDIALSLPHGYVEGRALAVTAEALELEAKETSNAEVYPRGRVSVARELITVIRVRKSDGRAPRVASQTIGQAAVFGGLLGLGSRNSLGGTLRSAGVQMGVATLGAAIGQRLDDRKVDTLIRIVREPGDPR